MNVKKIKNQVQENPDLITTLDKPVILELLRDDEIYYGEAGRKFLSASFLGKLIKEPWNLNEPTKHSAALTIGRYFHISVLEPEKVDMFEVVEQSRSSSKEWTMAQKDVDMCQAMSDKVLGNEVTHDLIRGSEGGVVYEEPGLVELEGVTFKGKADIVNHEQKLIVDLKSTSDIDGFKWSAKKFGYNSQAYIYSQMFGYDMIFVAVEKHTNRLGVFECSDRFYEEGKERLQEAVYNYKRLLAGDDFSQDLDSAVL